MGWPVTKRTSASAAYNMHIYFSGVLQRCASTDGGSAPPAARSASLIHHINQESAETDKANGEKKSVSTLYQGQLVTVLFNNQGGRFSFKTRVADVDPR